MLKQLLLLPLLLYVSFLSAQKKNGAYSIHIHKTNSEIKIDGAMDEAAWQEAEAVRNFFMVLPMDTSHAKVETEVRLLYDAENIYILATCFHKPTVPYRVESLRRDFVFGKNDNFLFFIDPFNDLTNGFTFGANAAGAQWDGMLYEGGKADLSWDNKWTSAVKNYTDKWIFEAAIPFKSIRYKKGITQWGINFSRLDITEAEKSSWAPVPRQFPTASLAYTGTLVWDAPPPQAGSNISVIPFVLAGVSKDFENKQKAVYQKEIGGDAKFSLNSSLNLDLTVNPDFSQVEVDRQVTNLDRFELFFPERRQFFLENADLFANFGYATIRPFFSRRIGLGVPIQYGARLSGKLNKDWRIGVMDMETKKVDATGLPAQNFSIIALQRKVFSRSNIGVLFINKQSINYTPGKDSSKPTYSNYNRNIGLEYNLASSNNLWTGKMLFIKSFSPGKSTNDLVQAAHLQYNSRRWLFLWQHEYVGKNYNAEVGYVPRQGYIKINPVAGRTFLVRRKAKIISHGPKFSTTVFFNENFKQTDNESFLSYFVAWRNQSTFMTWVAHDYVKLLAPFDPTVSNKDTLARGTEHKWNAWGTEFISKPQSLFTFGFSSRYGGYYANGTRLNLTCDLGYRFQPFVNLQLSASYNQINLPQPWGRTTFWLVGPRVDVTFSNKLFFTTFFQYNEQLKNMNLNTRFQWRYKPASDLFIVYTDNYLPAPFSIRNRAVVLKFNYWWNL
ncbi:MAG: carbohydrate binding family 9 domain-containing protein [Sphingobacteriales bacterium]|nr:carbohydrate binding family 9 domain-containing protein [Sphingobacteriales bacterium]MBI3718179.1 carbohydrate binding family 9 domain-containing protein [Sphingobacteriales bacterium]